MFNFIQKMELNQTKNRLVLYSSSDQLLLQVFLPVSYFVGKDSSVTKPYEKPKLSKLQGQVLHLNSSFEQD